VDYVVAEGLGPTLEKTRARLTLERWNASRGMFSIVGEVLERRGEGPNEGSWVLAWSLQGPVDADEVIVGPEQCVPLPFPHSEFTLAPYLAWIAGALDGIEGGVALRRLPAACPGFEEHLDALAPLRRGGKCNLAIAFGQELPVLATGETSMLLVGKRSRDPLVTRADPGFIAYLPDPSHFILDPLYPGRVEFPPPFERQRVVAAVAVLASRLKPLETVPAVTRAPSRLLLRGEPKRPGVVGVSVLGAGNFARAVLLYNLRREMDADLRGILDVRPEIASAQARALGFGYATTDPAAIFGDAETDLVLVASDHASHADYAVAALVAGKMVHIEKPPAVSPGPFARLVRCLRERPGAVFTVGYNRPFAPATRYLEEVLAGVSGPTYMVFVVKGFALPRAHWYLWPNQGTRIAGNFVHWIDLSYRLSGHSRPRWVEVAAPLMTPAGDADSRSLVIAFENGSLSTLAFSAAGDETFGVNEYADVKKGAVSITLHNFERIEVVRGGRKTVRRFGRDKGHKGVVADLAARVREGRGDPQVIEDMIATSGILFAAQASVATGGRRHEVVLDY